MDIVETVDIDAPADVVWSVIADVQRWPGWTDSIDELRVTSSGPMAVGSTAVVKQPRMPRATWTVTEWDPGRSFTWEASGPGLRTAAVHAVEPTGAATCRVTLSVHETGPLDGLMRLLYARRFRAYVALEAAGLARRSVELAAPS
jgi:uncharacterized membrane protein